ncbi:MAG: hypothetical protein WC822_06270, partial [Candidatus Paceibacterota bacterium]
MTTNFFKDFGKEKKVTTGVLGGGVPALSSISSSLPPNPADDELVNFDKLWAKVLPNLDSGETAQHLVNYEKLIGSGFPLMDSRDYARQGGNLTDLSQTQTKLDEFLTHLQMAGKTPDSVQLVKTLFPGSSDQQIDELLLPQAEQWALALKEQNPNQMVNPFHAPGTSAKEESQTQQEQVAQQQLMTEFQKVQGMGDAEFKAYQNQVLNNPPSWFPGKKYEFEQGGNWEFDDKGNKLFRFPPRWKLVGDVSGNPFKLIGNTLSEVSANPYVQVAGTLIALGAGAYQTYKSPVFQTYLGSAKADIFEKTLNTGIDKWIAEQGRLQGAPAQSWLGKLVTNNRAWLVQRATENYINRIRTNPTVAGAGVNIAEAATQDTISDISKMLIPKFTETNTAVPGQTISMAGALGGVKAQLPTVQRAEEATQAGGVGNVPPSNKPPVIVNPGQPSPAIPPSSKSEEVLGLRTIQPGLVRSEVIGNLIKRMAGTVYNKTGITPRFIEASEFSNPAFRERARIKPIIESKAHVIGTESEVAINDNFIFDKKGGIPNLAGVDPSLPAAPTIQDVAARLPVYSVRLTPQQLSVLEELRNTLSPYHELLESLGVELRTRGDVMEGGFYLPRGRAGLEGVDEPTKVGGGGRKGSKKGFEKPAVFNSMSEGISKGYEYSPIAQVLTSYAYDAGQRAVDAHVANYFKALTDETGQLMGETVKMRMLRQNPSIAKLVEEVNHDLIRLKSNIGALTQRQMNVIDLWQHDPEFDDLQILLDGLETMTGGSKPPATLPELQAQLDEVKQALKALKPEYDAAMRRAQVTPRDQGVIILPALQGRTFPNEVANAANKVLKAEGETIGSMAGVANVTNAFNNFYRGLRATLDNSSLGIQALLGFYNNPIAYGKALIVKAKAWMRHGDRVLGVYMREFDQQAKAGGRLTTSQWTKSGLHIGGATSEFQFGEGIGNKINELPVVKQANRAFGFTGDAVRLEWSDTELKGLL